MQKSKILLVDDDPASLCILEEILSDEYCLKTAASGEEALKITQEFKPDLVLLDVMMPGIDGCTVARRIREELTLRHTKIIMVSANTMLPERLAGYEAGADDYVDKPFERNELLAKVRVFFKLKSVEEIDQIKGDLLSLLSHETNTPLNSIMVPAELLMLDEDITPTRRWELAAMIFESAKRLQSLFDDVLKLTAMKAGKRRFDPSPLELSEIARQAMDAVAEKARERRIEIVEKFAKHGPVNVDKDEICGVVTNVLDNALRFSGPGNVVTVAVFREGDKLCLSVTDRGPGIDPEFMPRVFDEFTCADVIHHTSGRGLSMALAREILQGHDGSIGVESTVGEGTTFTVRLPMGATTSASTGSPGTSSDRSPTT